jgi:ribosomal protein L37AE/L43A
VRNVPDAKFDAAAFLANCKTRLLSLVDHDTEWSWWKYAQDQSWILPNESLAAAMADKIFEGYDPKDIISSVAGLFDAHSTAVKAMAANCPPEFKEEVKRGFVPMPRTKELQNTVAPSKPGNFCPSCNSTATKKHDDLVGMTWCQKCGTQWQDGSTVAYEEHAWMWAKLPFAPKDKAKPYKGMTLGQIARLDSKYWFGIVMNFKAEPFKGRPPSAESVGFGEACEAAKQHLKEAAEEEDDLPM